MFSILVLSLMSSAQLSPKNLYIQGYAEQALIQYTKATEEADKLRLLVQDFVANPSQEKMESAKLQWIEARKAYLPTEIYRYYESPIDDADGPEGMINAWPIDEAYIDSVRGAKNSGIINDTAQYPTLDEALLMSLNEKDGEKNISTGWHAIEFLLWGQDFNKNGPGQRPFTDYVSGSANNAERRGQYLLLITELLVEQLRSVTVQWDPKTPNNYVNTFVNSPDSLSKVVNALQFLAGEELGGERMYVAYDTQDQEDEDSCFSDTTHIDFLYDFLGIQGAFEDNYKGVTLLSLISEKDQNLAQQIQQQLGVLEPAMRQFPAPFDQAIFDSESRVKIKAVIDALQILSDQTKTAKGLL